MQRVVGIALGYEDLIDHDEPVLATLAGKLAARRSNCAPSAGKSTLNRLELSRTEPTRYSKSAADAAAIKRADERELSVRSSCMVGLPMPELLPPVL